VWKIFECGLKARRNLFISACPWFGESPKTMAMIAISALVIFKGTTSKIRRKSSTLISHQQCVCCLRDQIFPCLNPLKLLRPPKDSASESKDSVDNFHFDTTNMQTELNDLVQDLSTKGIDRIARL
jgi:hypothetical protein